MSTITIFPFDDFVAKTLPITCSYLPYNEKYVVAVPTWCFSCAAVHCRNPTSTNNFRPERRKYRRKYRQVSCRFGIHRNSSPAPELATADVRTETLRDDFNYLRPQRVACENGLQPTWRCLYGGVYAWKRAGSSMATGSKNEMLLNDPPTDGISSICFAPSSDLLLASSWDSVSAKLLLHE